MMWVCMYNKRTHEALNEVLNLNNELNQATMDYNLKIHPRTYSTLINSCVKVKKYNEGLKILRKLEQDNPELFGHTRIVQAAVILTLNAGDFDKAINILESKAKLDGDPTVWCQFETYQLAMMIRKIGQRVKFGGIDVTQNVEQAEQIFQKCITIACRNNVDIPGSMFNAMMGVYARNGDYDSCLVLMQYMIDPAKKHKNYPSPSISTFDAIFEALSYHQNNDEKWKKMDSMLKAIQKLNIEEYANWSFYCRLFDVCGDNVERAKELYDDLINKEIEPNMAVLCALFNVGVNHYNKDDPEFELFVRWIIDEHSKYGIIPTEAIKNEWKVALRG